ncbi:MAG: efflux transporter periplasmic adaptor subunit, partial [Gammaproteobacteria bacterium]
GEDVLQVPSSAVFRHAEGWAVFRADGDRARATIVIPGKRTGLEVEIREGLSVGEEVIIHPSDDVVDDVRIRRR